MNQRVPSSPLSPAVPQIGTPPRARIYSRCGKSALPALVHVDRALRSPSHPLDGETRVLMEPRFGYNFSQVRVHKREDAAASAEALSARAFSVGSHIVFGTNQYAPHSQGGRHLLAHELAHTIQQRGSNYPGGNLELLDPSAPAEREAKTAADHAVAGASARNLSSNSLMIARDSLADWNQQLQDRIRTQFQDEAYLDLLNEIANPAADKAAVIAKVNYLRVEQLSEALNLIGPRVLSDIAGSSQGIEVLKAIRARLPDGPRSARLDEALHARSDAPDAIPLSKATDADVAALERINRVIPADTHYQDYLRGSSRSDASGYQVPLHFPVQLYTAGRAVDGGVYYNPTLNEGGKSDVAGVTPEKIVMFKTTRGTTRGQIPLAYIMLGPVALGGSDSSLQSYMWHEFQHYQRVTSFRQPDETKGSEVKLLEDEAQNASPDSNNQETEAISVELADYFDQLSDAEAKSRLLYLARVYKETLPLFRQAAIDRVKKSVTKQATKKNRMLKLIDAIASKRSRADLHEFRDAIAKAP